MCVCVCVCIYTYILTTITTFFKKDILPYFILEGHNKIYSDQLNKFDIENNYCLKYFSIWKKIY